MESRSHDRETDPHAPPPVWISSANFDQICPVTQIRAFVGPRRLGEQELTPVSPALCIARTHDSRNRRVGSTANPQGSWIRIPRDDYSHAPPHAILLVVYAREA